MKNGDLVAKMRAQAARKNRRESNLRYQHHRAASCCQSIMHGANINFSFSAAGDSMKKKGNKTSLFEWSFNASQRRQLGLRKFIMLRVGQFCMGDRKSVV